MNRNNSGEERFGKISIELVTGCEIEVEQEKLPSVSLELPVTMLRFSSDSL